MTADRPSKIGIVGAGSVGATIAYACMLRGVAKQISLFDVAASKVQAEVLDLNHGLMFVPMAKVDGSDDLAVLANSDVIVVTAGAKQKPGQSRIDLAEANTSICRKLIPELQRVAPEATLLMVTNPVDVLTYVALKISGMPPERVIGSGTVLDSSRFRFLIAQRCQVAVQNVHAYIAGEHGDTEFPLWSSADIGNIPVRDWQVPGHGRLEEREQAGDLRECAHRGVSDHPGKGRDQLCGGTGRQQNSRSLAVGRGTHTAREFAAQRFSRDQRRLSFFTIDCEPPRCRWPAAGADE
jgi:L-lactate dehydrogenase